MLKPDKHTDIKYSIVFLSAVMMKEILENGIIKYDDLKNSLTGKIGKGITENYEYTLSYLFMLGKIEYVDKLDSIKAI
ncbi:ABC-three component system middle component 8 [Lunatibacter salilacus]|uniref:ABC-three component system middle component 8 n=1 Tax=Lunatibacter salilacus TaxID=2483804 RepID=UPI00131E743D|nr:ABC-three component system middle component 8 [Lunatibacter salilacus]